MLQDSVLVLMKDATPVSNCIVNFRRKQRPLNLK